MTPNRIYRIYRIYRNILIRLQQKSDFALYGNWEGVVACKILLRGVAVICPPGKHHPDNFRKSVEIRLEEVSDTESDTRLSENAKVHLKCRFYDVFLRVGVTKYCKLQYKMLPGSATGMGHTSRPL